MITSEKNSVSVTQSLMAKLLVIIFLPLIVTMAGIYWGAQTVLDLNESELQRSYDQQQNLSSLGHYVTLNAKNIDDFELLTTRPNQNHRSILVDSSDTNLDLKTIPDEQIQKQLATLETNAREIEKILNVFGVLQTASSGRQLNYLQFQKEIYIQWIRYKRTLNTLPNAYEQFKNAHKITKNLIAANRLNAARYHLLYEEQGIADVLQSLIQKNKRALDKLYAASARLMVDRDYNSTVLSFTTVDKIGSIITVTLISLSLILFTTISWFSFNKIVRPLRKIRVAMTKLATGNKEFDLSNIKGTDEIGHMASTVEVFRSNLDNLLLTQSKLDVTLSQLRTMLELSSDAIIMIDKNQTIQLFNRGAEFIFGYTSRELIGNSLEMLLPPEMRKSHKNLVQGFAAEKRKTRLMDGRPNIVGMHKNGQLIDARGALSKVDLGGETYFMIAMQDITDRLLDRQKLYEARAETEVVTQSQTQFLGNMSHELRTPLNAIIGFSEIMKNQQFGPIENDYYLDYAGNIHDAGTYLLGILNSILDLAKLDFKGDNLNEKAFDPTPMMESVETIGRLHAEEQNLSVTTNYNFKGKLLWADEIKVKQILSNLINNAIKFNKDGGSVALDGFVNDTNEMIFRVSDTGIGIALQDIGRITEVFMQVEEFRSRTHEGIGIGLALVQAFTDIHQGTMEINSELGKGSVFTIRFPAERTLSGESDGIEDEGFI